MFRPVVHAAIRPFRVTRATSQAHRRHAPTPYLGCSVCARIAATSIRSLAQPAV